MRAPRTRVHLDEDRCELSVWVERKMPLSSSHAGRRFVLAFLLGDVEVVTTRAFEVFAKKPKAGGEGGDAGGAGADGAPAPPPKPKEVTFLD